MFYSPKKMRPEILKVVSLCSTLEPRDQLRFLDRLIAAEDLETRRTLIDRAVLGERVWEEKQAV